MSSEMSKQVPSEPASEGARQGSIRGQGLYAGYGQVPVIRDVSIGASSGEVVVVLGPNGAGKSTTLAVLSGEVKPTSGSVFWLGEESTKATFKRCREGLSFITEERSIFPSLTTHENLRLGRGSIESALHIVPELERLLRRKAGLLSGGEQQLLVLARALAAEPKVLLADELSLGLAPLVVARLIKAIRDAADLGIAVILVEQHLDLALSVADRAYVMQRGEIVLEGDAADLRARRDEIEAAYLSTTFSADSAGPT